MTKNSISDTRNDTREYAKIEAREKAKTEFEKNRVSKAQLYLGPSQFAVAMGLSQFKHPKMLKSELEWGGPNPNTAETIFGDQQEALAIYCYRKRTGKRVISARRKKKYHLNERIGGRCDGLIVDKRDKFWIKGLLEIKCHHNREKPYDHMPTYHLVQVAGYLAIYQVPWCDFMSCCFNDQGEITYYKIFHITWNDVREPWEKTWYPYIVKFLDSIDWQRPKWKRKIQTEGVEVEMIVEAN